jgi:hypothetical protein
MLVEKAFNDDGTPSNLSDDINYAQSLAYDSASRLTQLVRGVDVLETVFDFNDWDTDGGRLLNLTTTWHSDSEILQNATYDYDSVGNIQTIIDSVDTSDPQTQTFQYDAPLLGVGL